jgi:ribosomal protein S27AE
MIQFIVEGANQPKINRDYVCPECGASFAKAHLDEMRRLCDTCDGYGIDPTDDPLGDYAFIVSDNDAIIIVHDLLNYGSREKRYTDCTLDPGDVLVQLSLSDYRIESMVNPVLEYDVDVKQKTEVPTEETLRVYVELLTKLADKALDIDESIIVKTKV